MSKDQVRTPVFAANWKMNKRLSEVQGYVETLESRAKTLGLGSRFEMIVAPPSTHLSTMKAARQSEQFQMAAQNCGMAESGAFTGEVAPGVFKELACNWTLVGHSERRHVFGESDPMLKKRLTAALAGGLGVIYCVGETIVARRAEKTFEVLEEQMTNLKSVPEADWGSLIIAYEPVWAIGTGETATPEQAQQVHEFIRNYLASNLSKGVASQTRILYGGSAKPDNSGALMEQNDVDGLLVGSASLEASMFADLIENGLVSRA